MVRSYLEIQIFRHRDRLVYELAVDPEAEKQLAAAHHPTLS